MIKTESIMIVLSTIYSLITYIFVGGDLITFVWGIVIMWTVFMIPIFTYRLIKNKVVQYRNNKQSIKSQHNRRHV